MPIALITGASSGIGRAYAARLAERGYDMVLVARRTERLEALAGELRAAHGVSSEIISADLEHEEGIAAVEARLDAGDPIDLLLNNAGFAARGLVAELDAAAFERMLRVNVLALARLSSAAMRRMRAQGSGTIVNVASGSVFVQMPGNAGYGSTKSFVISFTRHMQVEAEGSAVFVQLLIPGMVATEFHDVAGADLSRVPPQMVMDTEEFVAGAIRGLELREPICIPSMPDLAEWETYVAAERGLLPNVSRDRIAERYRD
jgi:short-subunit dehydrogenase